MVQQQQHDNKNKNNLSTAILAQDNLFSSLVKQNTQCGYATLPGMR
jgi:hypothetical protein